MQLSEAIELTREAFEDWWATYPLKKGKKAGHQAFAKIFLEHRATVDELMAGALAYAGERAGKDPAFTKHASTWLNGDCWKDETLPAKPIGHAGGSSLTDYALAQFGAAE